MKLDIRALALALRPRTAARMAPSSLLAIALLSGALAAAGSTAAQDLATVRVITFPAAAYTPLFLGVEKGVFEKHGIKVELKITPSSEFLRAGLAKGDYDIALSAVDNAVAMVEDAKKDAVIVTGGDTGMNEFIARSDIKALEDVRGKTVLVDAPNTAFALLAKKILKDHGLMPGRDYQVKPIGSTLQRLQAMVDDPANAASMLGPPFSFAAKDKGLKSFGRSSDLIGPYQSGGTYVMRDWAKANAPVLERYIAAYIESVRMVRDPANREQVISLVQARFKQDRKTAERTYEALMEPAFGIAPDARFDMKGFQAVLALRAEIEGDWGGRPPAPGKYVDLGYYNRALQTVGEAPR